MKSISTALLLTIFALPVSAAGMKDMEMTMPMPDSSGGAVSPFDAIMQKMHAAMDIQSTGNADRDFLAGMIPHHEAALEMAQVEIKQGKNPFALQLARDIALAQTREIMVMRSLLKTHEFPPNENGHDATARFNDAMMRMHRDMPASTGNIDHDFVAQMIPHHQAAIDMADIVLDTGSDATVETIALDITDAQQAEIAQMKKWILIN